MRKLSVLLALACICSWAASSALAGPGCCASKSGKATEAKVVKTGATCDKSASACARNGDEFPAMKIMVADEAYNCPMEARKVADQKHEKVMFIVAGQKFDDQDKALEAWVCASECYAKRFVSIACEQDGEWVYCDESACAKSCGSTDAKTASASGAATCSKSKEKAGAVAAGSTCSKSKGESTAVAAASSCNKGKDGAKTTLASGGCTKATRFRVAGHIYTNLDDAKKAAERAREAIKGVKITYRVDGKDVDCASKVCPTAKKDGKVQYVVGGECTPCEATAKVKLAKMQIEAAKKCLDQMARA